MFKSKNISYFLGALPRHPYIVDTGTPARKTYFAGFKIGYSIKGCTVVDLDEFHPFVSRKKKLFGQKRAFGSTAAAGAKSIRHPVFTPVRRLVPTPNHIFYVMPTAVHRPRRRGRLSPPTTPLFIDLNIDFRIDTVRPV